MRTNLTLNQMRRRRRKKKKKMRTRTTKTNQFQIQIQSQNQNFTREMFQMADERLHVGKNNKEIIFSYVILFFSTFRLC